jgi:hypothetical protein
LIDITKSRFDLEKFLPVKRNLLGPEKKPTELAEYVIITVQTISVGW